MFLSRLSDSELCEVAAEQRRKLIAAELDAQGKRLAYESIEMRRAQRQLLRLVIDAGDECALNGDLVRLVGLAVECSVIRVYLSRKDNAGGWLSPQSHDVKVLEQLRRMAIG